MRRGGGGLPHSCFVVGDYGRDYMGRDDFSNRLPPLGPSLFWKRCLRPKAAPRNTALTNYLVCSLSAILQIRSRLS
jgi:hypothetical protein